MSETEQVTASLLATALLIVSIAIRDRFTEVPWLTWLTINLMLAWVPLLLSNFLSGSSLVTLCLVLPIWLLFLPNAPYLATDIIYARGREWFDIIILIAVAIIGLWIGVLSFHQMMSAIIYLWNPVPIFVLHGVRITTSLAVGVGIYLGRILRWNSWDVMTHPQEILDNLLGLGIGRWSLIAAFSGLFLAMTSCYPD